jgi:hypothetical protein
VLVSDIQTFINQISMFIAYRLSCEICSKYVVVQQRIDCEFYVVSTLNGGGVITKE